MRRKPPHTAATAAATAAAASEGARGLEEAGEGGVLRKGVGGQRESDEKYEEEAPALARPPARGVRLLGTAADPAPCATGAEGAHRRR